MFIRAFLAIDLNDSIREALSRFQVQASNVLPIKWTSPQAMHLTVKFLGDIQAEQVPVLKRTLQKVVKEMPPFDLTIKGLGGFPSLARPRILWSGVTGDVDHLEVFVACIESALSKVGFTLEERPYHPHLTLSRIKSNSREIGKTIETSDLLNKDWVFGNLTVDRLHLFQSHLTPNGAIYSKIWELPLVEGRAKNEPGTRRYQARWG